MMQPRGLIKQPREPRKIRFIALVFVASALADQGDLDFLRFQTHHRAARAMGAMGSTCNADAGCLLDACGSWDGGNWVKSGCKLIMLRLQYLGYNENDLKSLRGNLPKLPDSTQSIPDDKLTIDDHPFPGATIPVTIAPTGFPQSKNVTPGDTITLRSEDSDIGNFPDNFEILFKGNGKTWELRFNTGCGFPLVAGDAYGSLRIVGSINTAGCSSDAFATTTYPSELVTTKDSDLLLLTPAATAPPPPCVDDVDFLDHNKYRCDEWLRNGDTTCEEEGIRFHYTPAEIYDVETACPLTCGTCPTSTISVTVPPKISKTASSTLTATTTVTTTAMAITTTALPKASTSINETVSATAIALSTSTTQESKTESRVAGPQDEGYLAFLALGLLVTGFTVRRRCWHTVQKLNMDNSSQCEGALLATKKAEKSLTDDDAVVTDIANFVDFTKGSECSTLSVSVEKARRINNRYSGLCKPVSLLKQSAIDSNEKETESEDKSNLVRMDEAFDPITLIPESSGAVVDCRIPLADSAESTGQILLTSEVFEGSIITMENKSVPKHRMSRGSTIDNPLYTSITDAEFESNPDNELPRLRKQTMWEIEPLNMADAAVEGTEPAESTGQALLTSEVFDGSVTTMENKSSDNELPRSRKQTIWEIEPLNMADAAVEGTEPAESTGQALLTSEVFDGSVTTMENKSSDNELPRSRKQTIWEIEPLNMADAAVDGTEHASAESVGQIFVTSNVFHGRASTITMGNTTVTNVTDTINPHDVAVETTIEIESKEPGGSTIIESSGIEGQVLHNSGKGSSGDKVSAESFEDATKSSSPLSSELARLPANVVKRKDFIALGQPKCAVCEKPVYEMEATKADGVSYHKKCFRCGQCNKIVSAGNYASYLGEFYCKPCFMKNFKLKGNYDEGFGHETHKKKWVTGGDINTTVNSSSINVTSA